VIWPANRLSKNALWCDTSYAFSCPSWKPSNESFSSHLPKFQCPIHLALHCYYEWPKWYYFILNATYDWSLLTMIWWHPCTRWQLNPYIFKTQNNQFCMVFVSKKLLLFSWVEIFVKINEFHFASNTPKFIGFGLNLIFVEFFKVIPCPKIYWIWTKSHDTLGNMSDRKTTLMCTWKAMKICTDFFSIYISNIYNMNGNWSFWSYFKNIT
jgi:hypothetical protein